MAALYSGGDNGSSWASEPTDVAAFSYGATTGETNPGLVANMSFMGHYLDVIDNATAVALQAAGVAVCVFYENTIGLGPAGNYSPVLKPTQSAYFSAAQADSDVLNAEAFASNLGLPSDRPIYYTVDFSATSADESNIGSYFQELSRAHSRPVGIYGNAGIMDYVRSNGWASWFWQDRSAGQWNNDTLYAFANVWQWPAVGSFNGHTYNPTGSPTVGGHTIDGDFAYTNDFGQWPAPTTTPPVGGGVNNATVTQPSATFTQAQNLSLLSPADSHDQVVFSTVYSTNISNVLGQFTLVMPSPDIAQYAYPMGNFSYDGGVTWNDFGFIFAGDFGKNPGNLPAVVIQPTIDSNGNISFVVAINTLVGGGGTIPLTINLALLVTENPGILPDSTVSNQIIGPQLVSQNLSYSNHNPAGVNPNYSTYRRIASDSFITTTNSTVSVNHGLGTIPNIAFWVRDSSSNDIEINPVRWSSTGHIAGAFGIRMNATEIDFFLDSSINKCYYRTYKDN